MKDLLCAANESQGISSASRKSRFFDSVLFISYSRESRAGELVRSACFYIRIICMVTSSSIKACTG